MTCNVRLPWAGAVLATLLASPALAADKLPNVVVLATGGTIAGAAASDVQAGYTSGQVGVEQLLAAVPQAKKLATHARRADLEHRLAGHERRGLAEAGPPRQRARRDARRGRRRHHPRHRHHRGDGLLPEPGRQVEEAGRPDRGHAPVDGALGRRPAQLLQRGRGGGEQGRGRPRRAGGRQRLDPRRLLAHQDEHHRGADVPLPAARAGRHRGLRRGRVLPRAGGQEHRGQRVLARRRHGAAAGGHRDGPREHGRRASSTPRSPPARRAS